MLVLMCVAIGLGVYLLLSLRTEKKGGRALHGPTGWPIIGSLVDMLSDKVFFKLSAYVEQYGDIYLLKALGKHTVVLNSAELIRKAFSTNPHRNLMNDRSKGTHFGDKIMFGSQSITFLQHAYEPIHNGMKNGFAKFLHMCGGGKKRFENSVQEELLHIVEEIEAHQGREFEFQSQTQRFIQNVMFVFLRGERIRDKEEYRAYDDFTRGSVHFFSPRVATLMKTFPFLRTVLSTHRTHYDNIEKAKGFLIKNLVEEAKATYKDGEIRGYLDYMISENIRARQQKQPEEQIVYNDTRIITSTLEVMGAGEVTMLPHLSSMFLLLMNYPEYQEKIQTEIDRVIGRDRLPTLEDKAHCPLVEAVALETHRYLPVLPALATHICKSDCEFEGFHIAKGTRIFPNTFHVMHDEKVWGDPWTFRPERFLNDQGELIPYDHPLRKSWMPFGTGRRQCAGENLARPRVFLYLTTLLQRWTFKLGDGFSPSSDPRDGDLDFGFITGPRLYKCRVVPRKDKGEL